MESYHLTATKHIVKFEFVEAAKLGDCSSVRNIRVALHRR